MKELDECLNRDTEVLNTILNIKIKGVASHGGMTGLNNLDFWKEKIPSDFGLLYEATLKHIMMSIFTNRI